jgi:DNA replication and repair protein RecF
VRLTRLEVRDVRIVQGVALRLHPSLSVISGGNGAGKTSLLEAIHVLGTGRSFRSREVDSLVRWGCRELSVFGEAQGADGQLRRLGVVKGGPDARVRVDGRSVEGIASVARLLPLATFGPESIDVVEGPPERRRALMDWALFHVEPQYGDSVLRYRRALRQRNAVLRAGGSRREAQVWESDLCCDGERVDQFRAAYSDAVLPYVADALASLTPLNLRLVYRRGWPASESLQHVLDRAWVTDSTRGWTGSGPHLADLSLQVGGHPARETLSRGEKKALAAALVLGHVEFLLAAGPRKPILLADDFASELDDRARTWFLRRALATGCQLVLSVLAGESLMLPNSVEHSVFHVERGEVREMV